mmetsp:Transcript_80164/g.120485  ORF Transcript_80164/g.120485 Transcript_80164/m.120485 type:complete len:253 (-) Transcript_80164:248-1006(-)
MTDNWDDSDDEWDVDDDALDAKLGLKKDDFADEEDLAVKEKEAADKARQTELKKKGSALQAKKQAEKDKAEELEIARKAMELEAEMEANMSPEERRALERQRIEDADHELTDDLFGGVEKLSVQSKGAQQAGDKVVMKDMKDHMKHARKVAECMKNHGKITMAAIFIKEVIQQSKEVLDDDAITDIIKTCNVIKNEKVQAAKRKVKGQAQKSKKQDKTVKAKAAKVQNEIFGDSNQYDAYDEIGEDYEDAFF